ncbi:hypothetical protein EK21DRAFT_62449 [Setomelanomma holmii]|uniref:gamma-glutamylcyclotransferase n=1 Tax=Setomelanomma holmii TaxID=210430 RepID=A0A9P4HD12_9PLEO|nr:hypothetical protein EK21DRAFT_62449 [Setomelanomma holmii]
MSKLTQHRADLTVHTSSEQSDAAPFYLRLLARIQSRGRGQNARRRVFEPLPQPSQDRLDASLSDVPIDIDRLVSAPSSTLQEKEQTVLYLAYGSNLCNETFRGVRGIRPLSQVNVLVPSLRLTFDLPGVPYTEPCFANTARQVSDSPLKHTQSSHGSEYHKDRWHKGLVGVVYEVTFSDYAHIIATEGGGSSYKDILVDCHVLPFADTVPTTPTSKPFKAHTLFAPMVHSDGTRCATERVSRPDPSYAQPSARYLKLITDGAAECDLPAEYQDYLHDIRPYTITSKKQAMGKTLFLLIWMPFILFIFALSKQLQDDKGRAPKWFGALSAMIFKGMWVSYDGVFRKMFGDGERTVGDEADETRVEPKMGVREVEEEGLLEEVIVRLDKQATKSTGRTKDSNDRIV